MHYSALILVEEFPIDLGIHRYCHVKNNWLWCIAKKW